jgi:hypothetical protein
MTPHLADNQTRCCDEEGAELELVPCAWKGVLQQKCAIRRLSNRIIDKQDWVIPTLKTKTRNRLLQ